MKAKKQQEFTPYSATVLRTEFIAALAVTTAAIKKKTKELFVINYAAGKLVLIGPNHEALVATHGCYWPRPIGISPQVMKNLVSLIPETDPLHISFTGGRLCMGKFSVSAQVVEK